MSFESRCRWQYVSLGAGIVESRYRVGADVVWEQMSWSPFIVYYNYIFYFCKKPIFAPCYSFFPLNIYPHSYKFSIFNKVYYILKIRYMWGFGTRTIPLPFFVGNIFLLLYYFISKQNLKKFLSLKAKNFNKSTLKLKIQKLNPKNIWKILDTHKSIKL